MKYDIITHQGVYIKDYDKILTRLIFTLTKLSNDERPTLLELSTEFGVSLKTIQRDIYQRLLYFPIKKDSEAKLRFEDGFSLKSSNFSIDEIITMSLSLEQIKDAGDEFNKSAKQITTKLSHKNLFNPYYIKPQLYENIDMDSPLLNKIENAIEEKMTCMIDGADFKEELRPLKIVNFDGIWYLLCINSKNQKIKMLFLSKIKAIKELKKELHAKDIDQVLESDIQSPNFEDGSSFEVVIHVKKNIAQYFRLKKHLNSQEILEHKKDGSLIIRFKVSTDEDIDNLIKSWLPDITVIKPKRFHKKIIKELKKYISDTMVSFE